MALHRNYADLDHRIGLPRPGQRTVFSIHAIQKIEAPDAERVLGERFARAEYLMSRTIDDEDLAILNTIHYHPTALTESDKTLGRVLNYVRNYPRARPSAPFIR